MSSVHEHESFDEQPVFGLVQEEPVGAETYGEEPEEVSGAKAFEQPQFEVVQGPVELFEDWQELALVRPQNRWPSFWEI